MTEQFIGFYSAVVHDLNQLLSQYVLAPGYGNDDESTYWVRPRESKTWVSLDWAGLQESWGMDFVTKWDAIKDCVLFRGDVYILNRPKVCVTNSGQIVTAQDSILRSFRKNSLQTVIDVLGQAYHVLYDSQNLDTFTQGSVKKIRIDSSQNIPTLVFEMD